MKYREIYAALAKRRMDVPGFRFSDYSGWRSPTQSYMTRQRPLWIVAEDPALSRRLWITQEGRDLSITVGKMDQNGGNCGTVNHISCRNRTELAAELRRLFDSTVDAA